MCGRGWTWIEVGVALAFNIVRLATTDCGAVGGPAVVATWVLAVLFIGCTQGTLNRGLVVNLPRETRYREIVVDTGRTAMFVCPACI